MRYSLVKSIKGRLTPGRKDFEFDLRTARFTMLYAGTSGFAYPSWKPRFYEAKLSPKRFLEVYASRLNSVEINYTFRRLAAPTTFDKWVAATPSHFMFCPKAHER